MPVAETRINASIFPKHFTVSSVTADPSKGTVAKYYRNWWVRLKLAKSSNNFHQEFQGAFYTQCSPYKDHLCYFIVTDIPNECHTLIK